MGGEVGKSEGRGDTRARARWDLTESLGGSRVQRCPEPDPVHVCSAFQQPAALARLIRSPVSGRPRVARRCRLNSSTVIGMASWAGGAGARTARAHGVGRQRLALQ